MKCTLNDSMGRHQIHGTRSSSSPHKTPSFLLKSLLIMPLRFACAVGLPSYAQQRGRNIVIEASVTQKPTASALELKESHGMSIVLTVNKLRSFGHKCEDEECRNKDSEKAHSTAAEKHKHKPVQLHSFKAGEDMPFAFFQTGMASQTEKKTTVVDIHQEIPDAQGKLLQPSNTAEAEVFPERKTISKSQAQAEDKAMMEAKLMDMAFGNNSLLQAPPVALSLPAAASSTLAPAPVAAGSSDRGEDSGQALAAVSYAVEARKEQYAVNDSVVDAVIDALEDGVGAQDPDLGTNISATQQDMTRSVQPEGNQSQQQLALQQDTLQQDMKGSAQREGNQSEQQDASQQTDFPPHYHTMTFASRRSTAIAASVGLFSATLLGVVCLGAGFWIAVHFGWHRRGDKGDVRPKVEALKKFNAADIERIVPSEGGYDCMFSKPISSRQLLRLEVRVEGPVPGRTPLTAPLTGRDCVLHSSSVSRQLHAGMPAVPVAFLASSIDFVVSMLDKSSVQISIAGMDVSLFDMKEGTCVEQKTFDSAPDVWQDFVLMHRPATPASRDWPSSSDIRTDNAILEFQECTLAVGAVVTVVGELHRGADGQLSMKPWVTEKTKEIVLDSSAPWRTSWENKGCEGKFAASKLAGKPGILRQKVLISDDKALLVPDSPSVDEKLRECTPNINFLELLATTK